MSGHSRSVGGCSSAPSAQARRHGAAWGPCDGLGASAPGRRAVHQSVRHLAAKSSTAASMRAAEAPGVLALGRSQRRAEDDGHSALGADRPPRGLGARAPACPSRRRPLGQTWRVPWRYTGTTGGAGAPGEQGGGGRAEGLGPAVGRAAALGEDHEVPAVLEQLGGGVGRAAVDRQRSIGMAARANDQSTAFQVRSKK